MGSGKKRVSGSGPGWPTKQDEVVKWRRKRKRYGRTLWSSLLT
jgi:hypothetical protein